MENSIDVEVAERKHNIPGDDPLPPLEIFGDGRDQPPSDEEFAKALAVQLRVEDEAAKKRDQQLLDKQSEELIKRFHLAREDAARGIEELRRQHGGHLDQNDPLWQEKRAQQMLAAKDDEEAANLYLSMRPQEHQPHQQQQGRPKANPHRNAPPTYDGFHEAQLPELWGPHLDNADQPDEEEYGESWKQRRTVAMMNAKSDEEASGIYLSMRAAKEGRKKDAKGEQLQIENMIKQKEAAKQRQHARPPAEAPVDDGKLNEQRALAMSRADDDEQAARIYIGMKDMALGKDRDPVAEQRLAEMQIERKKIWSCRLCTFNNSVSRTKCQACQTKRKDEKSQAKMWKCSECTLDNAAAAILCAACGKPQVL